MGAFTEMVTSFPWFLKIVTRLNSRVKKGVPSAAFCLSESPWGQSETSAEGSNGNQGAVGGERGHSLSGGPPPQPVVSP